MKWKKIKRIMYLGNVFYFLHIHLWYEEMVNIMILPTNKMYLDDAKHICGIFKQHMD